MQWLDAHSYDYFPVFPVMIKIYYFMLKFHLDADLIALIPMDILSVLPNIQLFGCWGGWNIHASNQLCFVLFCSWELLGISCLDIKLKEDKEASITGQEDWMAVILYLQRATGEKVSYKSGCTFKLKDRKENVIWEL